MIALTIGMIFALSICLNAKAEEFEVEPHLIHVTEYMDPDIPDEIEKAAELYGATYHICPELIEAICFNESSYKPTVKSADGSCIGLMQINASSHKARMKRLGINADDLLTVHGNMIVACDYLEELFEEYEEPSIVLMAYNGDSRWQQGEISYYAEHILEMAAELEEKHGKTQKIIND